MKSDIKSRADIELLINSFYEKVKNDDLIGYIFNNVANINWAHHLPIMYDFWEFSLLETASYKGNLIDKHIGLHKQEPLTAAHFERWQFLFNQTLDELFAGENVLKAKQKVELMKTLMLIKIDRSEQKGFVM
jgi:hemoglobin